MKIAIGSDKSGFAVKEAVKAWLRGAGFDFDDLGTVDPDRVMRALRASALVLDEQLKETRDALSKEAAKERAAGALTPEELDLFSDLLAAKESGDGEYALEQLQDAAYFLHKKGVEAVSYDKEHAAFFDVLPGEESRTLRPALLGDNGELLKKGVAQGGI